MANIQIDWILFRLVDLKNTIDQLDDEAPIIDFAEIKTRLSDQLSRIITDIREGTK